MLVVKKILILIKILKSFFLKKKKGGKKRKEKVFVEKHGRVNIRAIYGIKTGCRDLFKQ